MLFNALSVIVALGVLITFHEFGHYFVARLCGVKVLRFSVGFGKPIYAYKSRKTGTEFALALIPLGGYVKMLDEREGNVPSSLRDQTFNNKSVAQRFAIVAAGPIANFLLAIILYFFVASLGIQTVVPKLAGIVPESPMAQTNMPIGAEITQLNGVKVHSWEDVNLSLADLIGQSGRFTVRYLPQDSNIEEEADFSLDRWLAGSESNNLISAAGMLPWRPVVEPVIAEVIVEGAAAKAGFQSKDVVKRVNADSIQDWQAFVLWVQKSPGAALNVEVERNGASLSLVLTPDSRDVDGVVTGFAGLAVEPPKYGNADLRVREFNAAQALSYGIDHTWMMTTLTFSSIGKMIQGLISLDNLSGPITIAKVASASAESGLQSFLKFMAYLSVSLGVLNLLPIPMLDGGHLLFFGIEAIRRKPVSERVQGVAYRLGASLLFAMMAVALFNDIARL